MTPKCGTRCLYFVGQAFLCLCLTTFIFWLIFLPKEPKFTVSNASLTRFNFTNTDNTLYYNLALNVTIRNPNKRVGIYYRRIQVFANYRKKRFANVTLPLEPFYQGRKNTTTLNHVLVEGQQWVAFGEHDLSRFNSETAAGVYSIDVEIYLRVKARYGKVKTSDYGSSNIDCKLKVPVSSNNTSATKNTSILYAVLEGQRLVVFEENDFSQFNLETATGVYSIGVQLALRERAG
ncbi:unnamed protein product [Malus baccata var. baccata]